MAPRLSRCVAAVATAASGFVIAGESISGLGHLAAVAFIVVIPAIAISGLLPRADSAPMVLVSAAGAISINAVVAQTMLSVNHWSPEAAVVVIGFIAALLWLIPPVTSGSSVLKGGEA